MVLWETSIYGLIPSSGRIIVSALVFWSDFSCEAEV